MFFSAKKSWRFILHIHIYTYTHWHTRIHTHWKQQIKLNQTKNENQEIPIRTNTSTIQNYYYYKFNHASPKSKMALQDVDSNPFETHDYVHVNTRHTLETRITAWIESVYKTSFPEQKVLHGGPTDCMSAAMARPDKRVARLGQHGWVVRAKPPDLCSRMPRGGAAARAGSRAGGPGPVARWTASRWVCCSNGSSLPRLIQHGVAFGRPMPGWLVWRPQPTGNATASLK